MKQVSSGESGFEASELGCEENFSTEESPNESHLERETPSKEDSSESQSQSCFEFHKVPSTPSMEAEKHHDEDLGRDKNFSAEGSSSEENSSKSLSQRHLIIPKVPKLSIRNAKRKFVSKRKTTNEKAKKRCLRKNSSPDSDFIVSEKDESDSSSEDQGKDDSDAGSVVSHECQICHRSYKNYKSLKRHLNSHSKNGKSQFQCQTCKAAFDQRTDLEKHMRTHNGSRPYQCDECGSLFTQSSALKRHARIHSNLKPFSCDDCGASFTQSSSLKRHQNTHKQTKAFACKFCQLSFVEKHHLQQHVNSLHGDRPDQDQRTFTCNICRATFSQNSGLWFHKETVHQKNKNHECDKCGKSFSSKFNLNRHYGQRHPDHDYESDTEKQFECSVCGERFARSVSLKLHFRLHDTQEPYRCQVCQKTFKYKQWLRKHHVSHRCDNGYHCEKCGRKFYSIFLLCLHTKSNGGNCTNLLDSSASDERRRKHVCKYCNSRHSLSSRLAKHVRRAHPEAEVFTCDVCDKGFCYFLEYRSHRRTHRYVPYQCKTCEIAFPRYKQLLRHLYNHLDRSKTSATSLPSQDASSVSSVPADTGINENSSESVPESDLGKGLDTIDSRSKTGSETSVSTENSSAGDAPSGEALKKSKVPVKDSGSLKCPVCHLVFLGKLNYWKHRRLVHGERKYTCADCDKGFDIFKLLCLHRKSNHPRPKPKKKSDKIIKPKTAKFKSGKREKRLSRLERKKKLKESKSSKESPENNLSSFDKLLKAKVKEAMERSKLRAGTKTQKHGKIARNLYVID